MSLRSFREGALYAINLVDTVTQYETVFAVSRISEAFLIPALETALATFPFVIHGFHADSGSECVNRQVARLLDKLNVEFTKNRARRSNGPVPPALTQALRWPATAFIAAISLRGAASGR